MEEDAEWVRVERVVKDVEAEAAGEFFAPRFERERALLLLSCPHQEVSDSKSSSSCIWATDLRCFAFPQMLLASSSSETGNNGPSMLATTAEKGTL